MIKVSKAINTTKRSTVVYFVLNSNSQINFNDSVLNLTERKKRFLKKSWAKPFAEKVFPNIDEEPFSVLYSDKASRPNTPVNVIVGSMILKEMLGNTDDELLEFLMFDVSSNDT